MSWDPTIFLPDTTIGVIGGGQLGRMMALSARAMGYRLNVLDPDEAAPARPVADAFFQGAFTDSEAIKRLAQSSDMLVYEFEHIHTDALEQAARLKPLPQGVDIVRIAQHRALEKERLSRAGFPVAPYELIHSPSDIKSAIDKLGLPVVVKTTRGGYDGKGQWRLFTESDLVSFDRTLETIFAQWNVPESHQEGNGLNARARTEQFFHGVEPWQDRTHVPLIVERMIPFEKELSVIVARRADGLSKVFPVAENVHLNGILHQTVVPARVPEMVQRKAASLAEAIAHAFHVVGLLAVELFYLADGTLLVNELAPRPHNSGHYTLDAVSISQFEQFLRAVTHLPLGDIRLYSPVVMVNILGEHLPEVLKRMPTFDPRVRVHLYGKKVARRGRKMGHLNIVAEHIEEALEIVKTVGVE